MGRVMKSKEALHGGGGNTGVAGDFGDPPSGDFLPLRASGVRRAALTARETHRGTLEPNADAVVYFACHDAH